MKRSVSFLILISFLFLMISPAHAEFSRGDWYNMGLSVLEEMDPDRLTETILEKLRTNQEKDLARGYTSVGPHRDDIMLELDGTDVRVYGSQGQQRTTVLSLKLSVLEIMRGMRDESPVLLLDDVFSELDRKRQELLLKAISDCQTFITCTHLEELVSAGVDRMQVYSVRNGTVNEM